jgi:glycosyltransferase involved in cell wall biosynthesis
MMRLDDKNRVIVVYPPSRLGAIATRQIAHDCLVADLVDDVITREANREKAQIYFDNYCEILPKCNWIISTGEALKRYEPLAGQPINVFPNGVNTDEYEAVDRTDSKHKDSRKVVGYVGSINKTMDINVVKKCLEHFNDTDFVFYGFIGDVQGTRALREFEKYGNFYFKGELHYQQVPKFLKSCDVLIMPKKHDTATTGGDSIKTYQYLATGKPVVSTSIPPAPSFSQLIYVADAEDDFVTGIKAALNEKDTNMRDARLHEAKKHSWKNKISDFHRTVCSILEKYQQAQFVKENRN